MAYNKFRIDYRTYARGGKNNIKLASFCHTEIFDSENEMLKRYIQILKEVEEKDIHCYKETHDIEEYKF